MGSVRLVKIKKWSDGQVKSELLNSYFTGEECNSEMHLSMSWACEIQS